jgi:hypothetical protein
MAGSQAQPEISAFSGRAAQNASRRGRGRIPSL